jgi:hypothetical protein
MKYLAIFPAIFIGLVVFFGILDKGCSFMNQSSDIELLIGVGITGACAAGIGILLLKIVDSVLNRFKKSSKGEDNVS